jgi:hypothetical protein
MYVICHINSLGFTEFKYVAAFEEYELRYQIIGRDEDDLRALSLATLSYEEYLHNEIVS